MIEDNQHRSLIVLSRSGQVVGTLSDGDIRRKLLEGHVLELPVSDAMNTRFVALMADTADQAKDVFERENIFLIPVVDEQARLIDVIEAY